MKNKITPISSVMALFTTLVCSAGGMDSGGADIHAPQYQSAWFLGKKTIRYCMQVASDFGVSPEVLQSTIQKTAAQWDQYIKDRTVNYGRHEEFHLGLRLEAMKECDGTQDLSFFFGVTTPEVEQAKGKTDSLGFAYRTSYDVDTGLGKGFVWVNSLFKDRADWSWGVPARLHGILLHEFGHILGCGHIPGTIMREDIAEMIAASSVEKPQLRLFSIDYDRVLFSESLLFLGAHGEIHPGDKAISERQFERLVGRKPVGEIKARFRVEMDSKRFVLSYQDTVGVTDLLILPQVQSADQIELQVPVFKATRGAFTVRSDSVASVISGWLVAPTGVELPIALHMNMRSGALRIFSVEKEGALPLFMAAVDFSY